MNHRNARFSYVFHFVSLKIVKFFLTLVFLLAHSPRPLPLSLSLSLPLQKRKTNMERSEKKLPTRSLLLASHSLWLPNCFLRFEYVRHFSKTTARDSTRASVCVCAVFVIRAGNGKCAKVSDAACDMCVYLAKNSR